jgi:hypothetical protein
LEKGLSDLVLDLYRSATGKHTASYEDIQNEYVNIEPEYGLVDGAKNTEQTNQPYSGQVKYQQ